MNEHVHVEGERLVELVLSEAPLPAAVTGCPVCAAEAAALEDVVLRARRALDARELVSGADAERVAARVLARTTREDLGLDGDLALVTSFVRSRLSASRGLRLLAASLLVHLLALPVLAWFGLVHRRASDVPTFRFEPRDERSSWPEDEPLELPALDVPGALDASALDGTGRATEAEDGVADTLRIARFLAARGAPPLPPAAADEGEVERLLRLRAETLDAYAKRTQPSPRSAVPPATSAQGRVLRAELLLDRHALGGANEAELAAALEALDPRAARPTATLEALALARAEAYGVFRDDGRLESARRALEAELGELVARPADGVRRVDPLDRRWMALLRRALAPELVATPVVAAWLADGR